MLGKRKVSCILIVLYMRRIGSFRNDCYALLREQPGESNRRGFNAFSPRDGEKLPMLHEPSLIER